MQFQKNSFWIPTISRIALSLDFSNNAELCKAIKTYSQIHKQFNSVVIFVVVFFLSFFDVLYYSHTLFKYIALTNI